MSDNRKKIHLPLYLFILILILGITVLQASGWVTLPAFANAFYENYTTALEDLSKDENFNAEKYMDDASDYSLQIIQIAESSNFSCILISLAKKLGIW